MRVDQLEALRAIDRLHLHGGAERDAALARERQFERERIEQRLGRNDRVAAILAQLGAVAHRRARKASTDRAPRVIVDVEGLRDRAGGWRTRIDRARRTPALRRRGDRAPGPAARNARPAGRWSTRPIGVSRSDRAARLRRGARSMTPVTNSSSDGSSVRRRQRARRQDGRADRAAPPRQFARIRLVADVPFDGRRCRARGTGGRNGRAGAVVGRAIASDVAVHALSNVRAIKV